MVNLKQTRIEAFSAERAAFTDKAKALKVKVVALEEGRTVLREEMRMLQVVRTDLEGRCRRSGTYSPPWCRLPGGRLSPSRARC